MDPNLSIFKDLAAQTDHHRRIGPSRSEELEKKLSKTDKKLKGAKSLGPSPMGSPENERKVKPSKRSSDHPEARKTSESFFDTFRKSKSDNPKGSKVEKAEQPEQDLSSFTLEKALEDFDTYLTTFTGQENTQALFREGNPQCWESFRNYLKKDNYKIFKDIHADKGFDKSLRQGFNDKEIKSRIPKKKGDDVIVGVSQEKKEEIGKNIAFSLVSALKAMESSNPDLKNLLQQMLHKVEQKFPNADKAELLQTVFSTGFFIRSFSPAFRSYIDNVGDYKGNEGAGYKFVFSCIPNFTKSTLPETQDSLKEFQSRIVELFK